MNIHSAKVFESGSGQMYGLVSLEDSHQVVAFYLQDEGAWWGACEFNTSESCAAIGLANIEVQLALDSALDAHITTKASP